MIKLHFCVFFYQQNNSKQNNVLFFDLLPPEGSSPPVTLGGIIYSLKSTANHYPNWKVKKNYPTH